MKAAEGIPPWDRVTQALANALKFAFGCHHAKLSRVFTIQGHSYKVCCDCGDLQLFLRTTSVVNRRRLFLALRRLRGIGGEDLLRRTGGA